VPAIRLRLGPKTCEPLVEVGSGQRGDPPIPEFGVRVHAQRDLVTVQGLLLEVGTRRDHRLCRLAEGLRAPRQMFGRVTLVQLALDAVAVPFGVALDVEGLLLEGA
jgi:hypothetical protein